ncbi:MAG: thioredoxin family protein [Thaumarchaeota archaeon]|nr:thioredoxin family protein [Nitrososphaerota archaeon]
MKELEEELLRERHHREGRSLRGEIIEVKSSSELIDLISSTPLLLVDVYTTWCIPCRWMAGALERLADELSEKGFKIAKADAGKVDVERVVDELRLEPIRGVPTLLVFKDGKEVGRIVGAHPKPEFPRELKRRILEAVKNSEND